ncbi:hypothetical protein E2C01_062877 [Portunus trituberculatus]|uniref:Secreted protein n=1 Tax=Portunus trituberculatus TaxID=210409 RepID=A0A5B7HJB2_PORTR|nr:hypothetical protein [Portunus trituberculatus]
MSLSTSFLSGLLRMAMAISPMYECCGLGSSGPRGSRLRGSTRRGWLGGYPAAAAAAAAAAPPKPPISGAPMPPMKGPYMRLLTTLGSCGWCGWGTCRWAERGGRTQARPAEARRSLSARASWYRSRCCSVGVAG